jgi:hypothetical protein
MRYYTDNSRQPPQEESPGLRSYEERNEAIKECARLKKLLELRHVEIAGLLSTLENMQRRCPVHCCCRSPVVKNS